MANTGKGTQRIIKKYAIARTVRHKDTLASQTYDVNGLPNALPYSELSVQIHDQPADGKTLDLLPEGLRTKDVRVCWTIETGNIDTNDEVNIDGFIYTVKAVKHYQTALYGHKEFVMVRTGAQDNTWT